MSSEVNSTRSCWGAGDSLVAVGSASLLAMVVENERHQWLQKAFSNRVLCWLGTYSYGIYVLHAPVIIFLRDFGFQVTLFPTFMGSGLPGLLVFAAVATSITLLLAWLSYRYLESPFLRMKGRFEYGSRRAPRGFPSGLTETGSGRP